jgi:hypothetical protein
MQIACKRYGCQKAVEVCYWACKYRRNCKDWQNALAGSPGAAAIQGQLEESAKKSGRIFDAGTMTEAARVKRAATAPLATAAPLTLPNVEATAKSKAPDLKVKARREPVKQAKAQVETNGHKAVRPAPKSLTKSKESTKTMAKPLNEELPTVTDAPGAEAAPAPGKAKTAKPKAAKPPAKTNGHGPVYLLLNKNGKYKVLRESDLTQQAASLLNNPALRLVKGHYLIPQISFSTLEE